MILPIEKSLLAEIEPTWAISLVVVQGLGAGHQVMRQVVAEVIAGPHFGQGPQEPTAHARVEL